MVQQDKRLMELRKDIKRKRPSFRRVESWRHLRVKDPWRKARGIDSQTRMKTKSGVRSPGKGYRAPKKVRGIHPSGYEEVRVETINDLESLNNKKHALKISSKLGAKKRMALIDQSKRRGFKILNIGISQREIDQLEAQLETSIAGLDDDEYLEDEE
jgi:large subunit ribosomal protein L32e